MQLPDTSWSQLLAALEFSAIDFNGLRNQVVATARTLLDFLPGWNDQLQEWSLNGRLTAAAQEALQLNGDPQELQTLVNQLSAGDFQSLPEIVLLSNTDINGALGAYAQSKGIIYLNADWFNTATQEAINSVLTEELGHHLDAKLNQKDTPGDEGEYFSDLLKGAVLTEAQKAAVRTDNDSGLINVSGLALQAEFAVAAAPPSILLTTPLGYAVNKLGGPPIQVTYNGQYISSTYPGAGWIGLAATLDGMGYNMYVKNTVSGKYVKWILDANGAINSGAFLTSSQELEEETLIGYDINGDGTTGLTYTAGAATIGSVNLGTTQLGYAIKNGGNPSVQVSYKGEYISPTYPGAGWIGLAATVDGAGYDIYVKNMISGQYVKWILDTKGAIVGGAFLTAAQELQEETTFGYDIDGDGTTGLTYTAGAATIGSVNLGTTQLGYAIKNGGSPSVQVTYKGDYISPTYPGAGWIGLAATVDGAGYNIYVKNTASGQYVKWILDANGVIVGGAFLTALQELQEETTAGYDINGDGTTGLTYTAGTATIGSVNLGTTQLGYAIKKGLNSSVQVTYNGDYISPTYPGAGWIGLAALINGSGYDMYIKNTGTNQYAKWILDSKGAIINGAFLTTAQVLLEEPSIEYDINGDGAIDVESAGLIKLSIDSQGIYTVQSTLPTQLPDGISISPKEQLGSGLIRQKYRDLSYGFEAQPGDSLSVLYTGKLIDGTIFDSNTTAGRSLFDFTLGTGSVIQGFDLGLMGASLGDIYHLEIPPSLGYGSRATASIPANSTLLFDVEIRGISRGTSQLTFQNAIGNTVDKFTLKKDNLTVNSGTLGADWKILAAERISEKNQVLWKNLSTNKLLTWTMDSGWNWVGSGGLIDPLSGAGKELESQFGVDINGDGSILAYKTGTISADIITGSSSDEFFVPLGVSSTGIDRIILGGGSNQIQLQASSTSNLYANSKESDFLVVEGFNVLTDKLLLAANRAYGFIPANFGADPGTAIYEDNNGDKLYNNNDELLAWMKGLTTMSANSLLLG